jgi:hypothetical protein
MIRRIEDGTFMTCQDCGHAVSMNKLREKPLQSASDILQHMATLDASPIIAGAVRFASELLPPCFERQMVSE